MADRTSAEIFGDIFEHYAQNKGILTRELVEFLWELKDNYDFMEYQMGVDDALLELGFARLAPDCEDTCRSCIEYLSKGKWV